MITRSYDGKTIWLFGGDGSLGFGIRLQIWAWWIEFSFHPFEWTVPCAFYFEGSYTVIIGPFSGWFRP